MSAPKWCLLRLAPLLVLLPPAVRAVFDNSEIILAPGDYLDLGQLDRFEYLMLMIIVTVFFVVWAVGVLPVDVPLSPYAWRRKRDAMTKEGALSSIMWDCPLQYVCEVDHWANRDHHDYFIESMIAKWLRNSSNNTFYSAQGKVFGGLPETCAEMYPCPFDIQEVVGIRIPGSSANRLDVDHPDPDAYMSLL